MWKPSVWVCFCFLLLDLAGFNAQKQFDFDFTRNDLEKGVFKVEVSAEDSITLKCAYARKDFAMVDPSREYEYCFEYVQTIRSKHENIKRHILGFPLLKRTIDDNQVTTMEVTFPSFIPADFSFRCECYTRLGETPGQYLFLDVKVNKTNNSGSVRGCNYDNGYFESKGVEWRSDFRDKYCNIYDARAGDTLVFFCPRYGLVHPPNCFEKVYQYKNEKEANADKLSSDPFKEVPISSLIHADVIPTKANANSAISILPKTISSKPVLFTCACFWTSEFMKDTEIVRINIFLNSPSKNIANYIPSNDSSSNGNSQRNGSGDNDKEKEKEKEQNSSSEENKSKSGNGLNRFNLGTILGLGNSISAAMSLFLFFILFCSLSFASISPFTL